MVLKNLVTQPRRTFPGDDDEKILWGSEFCGALQPCPSGRLTHRYVARYAKSKLPSATSFIRKTLGEIP